MLFLLSRSYFFFAFSSSVSRLIGCIARARIFIDGLAGIVNRVVLIVFQKIYVLKYNVKKMSDLFYKDGQVIKSLYA